jgi:hypothetical protein
VTVRLSDYVVAWATDTNEGLGGAATSGDSRKLVDQRVDESSLSEDEKAIFKISSKIEGTFSKMNTWDRQKITYGFVQWTAMTGGTGSLVELMKEIEKEEPEAYREYFESYGLDVEGGRLTLTQLDGTVLRGAAAVSAVQVDPALTAVFAVSGTDERIQRVQIAVAAETKLRGMRDSKVEVKKKSVRVHPRKTMTLAKKRRDKLGRDFKTQTLELGDLISSEYGVGVMVDRAIHTGEYGTRDHAALGLLNFLAEKPDADLSDQDTLEAAAAAVVARLVAIDRTRAKNFAGLSKDYDSFSP